MEKKLNPTEITQIGGGDGPHSVPTEDVPGTYVKILSYSVKHVSILVHLERDGDKKASALENPQISYRNDDGQVTEYSIEQQLRLGCDNKGQMYKYSIVLQRHPKKEESETSEESATETSNTGAALGKLSGAFENLAAAAQSSEEQ